MQWLVQTIEGLFYNLISPLILCKTRAPQKREALSTSKLSNEDIVERAGWSFRVDGGTYINEMTGQPNHGSVAKIAPDTVVKCTTLTGPQELLSAELVRKYTAIPVPMHERVFRGEIGSYLVQQFISGRALLDVWPYLGWWMRLRVAITLRFYIYELRCMSSRTGYPPFPGPPSDDGKPRRCIGHLFTQDGCRPLNSYSDLSRWYQNRLPLTRRFMKNIPDPEPFDDSAPLVFIHGDLHPRNIILGDDGQLWIIDWYHAGWYPSWFESASMTMFMRGRSDIPSSWTAWIPFIAGSCEKPGQMPFIRAISYSLLVLRDEAMRLGDAD